MLVIICEIKVKAHTIVYIFISTVGLAICTMKGIKVYKGKALEIYIDIILFVILFVTEIFS